MKVFSVFSPQLQESLEIFMNFPELHLEAQDLSVVQQELSQLLIHWRNASKCSKHRLQSAAAKLVAKQTFGTFWHHVEPGKLQMHQNAAFSSSISYRKSCLKFAYQSTGTLLLAILRLKTWDLHAIPKTSGFWSPVVQKTRRSPAAPSLSSITPLVNGIPPRSLAFRMR